MLMMAVRISVMLAVALALMPLLHRRSAALRAWILISALACAAVLPLLHIIAPGWGSPIEAGTILTASSEWSRALIGVWALGAALNLFVLGAGVVRLMGVAAAADPIRDGRCADLALDLAAEYRVHAPVLLLEADRAMLPVTWGHSQPKVLLPQAARDWSDERLRVVLCHEIAHVRRRDWLVQLLATFIRSIYWVHPLVWLVCSRIRLECERACDDAVLRHGIDGSRYAEHLLDLARAFVGAQRPAHATSLLGPSTLERRVRSMLARRADRSPAGVGAGVAVAIVMMTLAGGIAGFGAKVESEAHTFSLPPKRLTLLLDGRIMDLSKEWPTYPDPRAGLVVGPGFPGPF
jgi:beta-lactamase regulating signal transducer with metallopeptidase domain